MLTAVAVCLLGAFFQTCRSDPTPNLVHPAEVCSLQPKTGVCRALFRMYYHNASSNVCRLFAYGGCGGNGNRFDTAEDCVATCGGTVEESDELPSFHGDFEDYDLSVPPCLEPVEHGTGRRNLIRFHFNGSECAPFVWSGSGGNGNNFKSMKQCKAECMQRVSTQE